MVCDKTKLVGVLFKTEPYVPLLVVASVSTSMLKPLSMSAKSQILLCVPDCSTGF